MVKVSNTKHVTKFLKVSIFKNKFYEENKKVFSEHNSK